MWDRKRQLIWLVAGAACGTFFLLPQAREESGRIDWPYFLLLEAMLLIVIAVMFFVYSRKQ